MKDNMPRCPIVLAGQECHSESQMSGVCLQPVTLPWVGQWDSAFHAREQLDIPEILGMSRAN